MELESKIPQTELSYRISSIKTKLTENNFDALIVPLGVYFYYFFGKQGKPSERLITGIIPVDEESFILSPSFEISNLKLQTQLDDVVGWNETESPYKILASELNDRKIGQNIAMDPRIWLFEVEQLEKESNRKYKSISSILYELRSVKSEWEVMQLQKAAKYSSEGILKAIQELKQGTSENEFKLILSKELENLSGNPSTFVIVQFGENSAIPHGAPTTRKLHNDEVVLIDAGTSVNGYQGDITITIPFGKPKKFGEIYDIVYDANRKAYHEDKSGVLPSHLDNVARSHIKQKGYGKNFTHRLGHGIGLEGHETPYIVASNQVPLVNGNTHTIEPGIYIPGKFGVRIEDDVMITDQGAEFLYKTSRYNFKT